MCFLLFFKCTSSVHSGHYSCCLLSLTLWALICPCQAPFRCHRCEEVFFDYLISQALSQVTCYLTWFIFVLELITIGLLFVCFLIPPLEGELPENSDLVDLVLSYVTRAYSWARHKASAQLIPAA